MASGREIRRRSEPRILPHSAARSAGHLSRRPARCRRRQAPLAARADDGFVSVRHRRADAGAFRRHVARDDAAGERRADPRRRHQGRKIRHARERNHRRFGLLFVDARQARRRRSAPHRREQRARYARHRPQQRAIGIFAGNLVEAGVGMARLDERGGPAARRKAAHALPSLLGAAHLSAGRIRAYQRLRAQLPRRPP